MIVFDSRFLVAGAGGGGGKGGKGGGGGGGGTEAKNTLKSKQVAKVIDVLSEGPIVGLVNGGQSVWFDGVRAENPDGSTNFSDAGVVFEPGLPDQPILPGFASQQSEISVNSRMVTTGDLVRTILNADADRVRITVSVPALQSTDKDSGDTKGTSVEFEILIQSNGGGFRSLGIQKISGKSNTKYQRAYVMPLNGPPPWDIRLHRVTKDSTKLELQNDTYWDSYTTIIDARVNYNSTAVMAITIDAEQFASIPQRVYQIEGRMIQIPSNYDPRTNTYTGTWDGTFKIDWTNNPAWIYYDLVTHTRYGLGQYISPAQVDKWSLYQIGQFCDQPVDDGKGGLEPRFVCNIWITEAQEAYNLLGALASIFRGFSYWSAGQMVAAADMPSDPIGQYANSDVIDGLFTYSGADVKARHNMAYVSWKDPANLGEPRISIVEDQEDIARNGIISTQVTALGCTSESQALRVGRWTLFTEIYESEICTFSVGLRGAWSRPGNVVMIADRTISGKRRGGRIISATTHVVNIDSPMALLPGEHDEATDPTQLYLSVYVEDNAVASLPVIDISADGLQLTVLGDFSAAPMPGTTWVVTSGVLEAVPYRIMGVKEASTGIYEISALRHRPDKWSYVEQNMILSDPNISVISAAFTVTNLNAIDYLMPLTATSLSVQMLVSWTSLAPMYDVIYKPLTGNAVVVRTTQTAIDVPVVEDTYEITVIPINSIGIRGVGVTIQHTVIGRTALPADPQRLRVQVVNQVAMFAWAPTKDVDVLIGGSYEMRYTPRIGIGADWPSSNPVLLSIPGTATSVELPYREGTYLLRAKDILGQYSANPAVISTTSPDIASAEFYRICESPSWTGAKANTGIYVPNDWLILGNSGGLWDSQMEDMDTWPQIDTLPFAIDGQDSTTQKVGTYNFHNLIDLGGVFTTTLAVDMLAFPFSDVDDFVDSRPGNVDTWQSWDSPGEDLRGQVTIQVRQTDSDPAGSSPAWTDWTQFIASEYRARAFEFRAVLTAPFGQNVAVEELCVTADISNKVDQGNDLTWLTNDAGPPPVMHIDFNLKFYLPPSLSVLVQEGVVGDTVEITNKDNQGFDLRLIGAAGSTLPNSTRTFDWIASGY